MTPDLREPRRGGLRRLPGPTLPVSFYARDTLRVAREVLGCLVARREADGSWTVGRIVETEAYVGEDDPACHAAAGLTPRTRVMYGRPGRAYVYFTYGMHHCLNLVTETVGFPAAVLVRALRPLAGLDRMERRRGRTRILELTSGPSRLCCALGVDLAFNEAHLGGPDLVLREGPRPHRIVAGPRVGIRRGVTQPWRFWVAEDPFVSRGRPGPPAGRRVRRGGG
jgi:DNA-3-methyladenine glycosylase